MKKEGANRPKIGLALGAGGARGYAHIGVLQVLKEHGIPVDYIAGSSMGSVVGVLFANQLDVQMMKKLAISLKQKTFLDYTVPRMGFIKGEKIKEIIRLLTHGKNLEDLAIPTAVVATDIIHGERVVFDKGPIADAVRASISIPGVFEPVQMRDRLLVDGGVIDRVPASVVRDMGADLVIAVDVSSKGLQSGLSSIFDVISQTIDIMEREIFKYRVVEADLVIRPPVGHYSSNAFDAVEAIIAAGEQAAADIVGALQQFIAKWEEKDGS